MYKFSSKHSHFPTCPMLGFAFLFYMIVKLYLPVCWNKQAYFSLFVNYVHFSSSTEHRNTYGRCNKNNKKCFAKLLGHFGSLPVSDGFLIKNIIIKMTVYYKLLLELSSTEKYINIKIDKIVD